MITNRPALGSSALIVCSMVLIGSEPKKRLREIDKEDSAGGPMWNSEDSRKQDELFLDEILSSDSPSGNPVSNTFSSVMRPRQISSFVSSPYGPGIKKRRRLLPEETACLIEAFEKSQRPSQETRDQLAARLRMSQRAIQIWFQNRRAKVKRDAADAGKSSLSFAPSNATIQKPTLIAVRRIEPFPAATKTEDTARFEEIFQMPDIEGPWLKYETPMMAASHSARSSLSAGTDFGTPLTWDEPDWATGQWMGSHFQHSKTMMMSPTSPNDPLKSLEFQPDLSWMDDFIQS